MRNLLLVLAIPFFGACAVYTPRPVVYVPRRHVVYVTPPRAVVYAPAPAVVVGPPRRW